ncbi:MAG: low molecular weight phosphatase family protein, partial [Alphaproteobacteria bacterium]|nr:low molecular weight phosphatase family protein [Alphaproteobacteria bacterium]
EAGSDIHTDRALTCEGLSGSSFDLVIALSAIAFREAMAYAASRPIAVEHWDVVDPTSNEGSREQRLIAFRSVRDDLEARIRKRFPNHV